jgi:hypothetical protein
MIVFFSLINYIVWDINNQTKNTASALGEGFYILGYFALSIITTVILAYLTKFKEFKKIDYVLFILCSPVSSIITILFSK